MTAALVFLAAFLTGVSGNPSVTMRPEIDSGSELSSSVPGTVGEAQITQEVRPNINAKNTMKYMIDYVLLQS